MLRYPLVTFSVLFAFGVGAAAPRARAVVVATPTVAPPAGTDAGPGGTCPRGTLLDGDVCVHLPGDQGLAAAPEAPVAANAHRARSGRWQVYEDIPRRPDRPEDYDAYRYPVPPGISGGHSVVSGFDLDKPDEAQRRGRTLRAVGHGGVDLPQVRGTPARLVALEHQEGDAEVIFVGALFGTTVITRQMVREAGRLRDYVVLFGHLDGVAPNLGPGALIHDGEVVGFVGDTGSPELVHLHWEARRVRDGVNVASVARAGGAALLADEVSVVCDPRNVLPLRPAPSPRREPPTSAGPGE